jgi:hypothetical protein
MPQLRLQRMHAVGCQVSEEVALILEISERRKRRETVFFAHKEHTCSTNDEIIAIISNLASEPGL